MSLRPIFRPSRIAVAITLAACSGDGTTGSGGGGTSPAATSTTGASSTASASTVDTSAAVTNGSTSGTSTSSTGGGPCDLGESTAPSTADCAGYCNKLAEAACPADPSVSDCVAACQAEVSYYAVGCEAETVAVVSCWSASGVASCTADGHGTIDGCPNETQAFNACVVCVAVPGDTPCQCCEISECCLQSSELVHRPDFPAYAACREACNNSPSCWDGCNAMYPVTGAAFDDYNFCIGGKCGTPCLGG